MTSSPHKEGIDWGIGWMNAKISIRKPCPSKLSYLGTIKDR